MINILVLAASLIVSPPTQGYMVVPQESMETCKKTARIWSLEWRHTEFLCIPFNAAEATEWYPETFGPREPPVPPKKDVLND